jgi:hypothetical protein
MIIAQGKRAAALGYGGKMISFFFPSGLRLGAPNRKGKRRWGWGGALPRAADSAAFPWAGMWLPFQGAGVGSPTSATVPYSSIPYYHRNL